MTHILDELTLQRCVDGELSEAEQQALLRQLERNPAGWREVALGFMEHQLWSSAGQDWIHEPAAPQVSPRETIPARSHASWLRNTALMASTLLAIGLGYVGGSRSFWSSPSGSSPGGNIALVPSRPGHSDGVETALVSMDDPSRQQRPRPPMMQVRLSSNGQDSKPISLPVYDAADLPQVGDWPRPRLSDEERQNLTDQGFQIREEPHYYTVPIDNNRHLVVPINTVHVRQLLQ